MKQDINETVTENNIITTLTTAVIEDHLRVSYSAESSYIDLIAYAAQEAVEKEIGEVFGSIAVVGYNSEFTRDFTLPYPASRCGTITVSYLDKDGTLVAIDAGNVKASKGGYPIVVEISDDFKPASLNENSPNMMKFEVTVAAKSPIPKALQQAVLLMMGHMYENREAVLAGRVVEPPLAFKYLCGQYKHTSIRQPYNPEFIVR